MANCQDSINSLAGYLAWKREKINQLTFGDPDRRANALVANGFRTQDRGDGYSANEPNFVWKEARCKKIIKKTYQFEEYYDHFYLDSEFDNDTYSYTAQETNRDTGQTETVTYQVVETDGSQLKSILAAIGIANSSSLYDLPSVPLPLRVWTISSGTNPPYSLQVIGRLTGMNGGNPIVKQFGATDAGDLGSIDRNFQFTDYSNEDMVYTNRAQNTLTYTQKRNHIITVSGPDKFQKISEETEVSQFIIIYVYEYNFASKQYQLKQKLKKEKYTWMDIKNRSCSVTSQRGARTNISVKVKKTYPDGCYKIYSKKIGYKVRDTYTCIFYTTKAGEWTPSTDPLDPQRCALNNPLLSSLAGLTPGTYEFKQRIESQVQGYVIHPDTRQLVPLNPGVLFLPEVVNTNVTNSYTTPIKPDSCEPFVEFSVQRRVNIDPEDPNWKPPINY